MFLKVNENKLQDGKYEEDVSWLELGALPALKSKDLACGPPPTVHC